MTYPEDTLTDADLRDILKYSPDEIEREIVYRILLKRGLLP